MRSFLYDPDTIKEFNSDIKEARCAWLAHKVCFQLTHGRISCSMFKGYSFEDFQLEYAIDDFKFADIIRDIHTHPLSTLKEDLYQAFSKIEFKKYENDEAYWPDYDMYGKIVSKKYPKLEKGEKKLSYVEFEKELISKEEFLKNYIIETLLEEDVDKYKPVVDQLFHLYLSSQYTDYEVSIGFYESQISFEEYQRLYLQTIEEYAMSPYVKEAITKGKDVLLEDYKMKYSDQIQKGYDSYCKSRYSAYKTVCNYGPYHNPGTMI